ncbi:MAG: M1 family metallopeptidase [Acidobacteriota bacterium]
MPSPLARPLIPTFLLALLAACAPQEPAAEAPADANQEKTVRDVHSFARPDEVAVRHLTLDLTVDFEAKQLVGRASLDLDRRSDAQALYLDTRELDIRAVTLDDGVETTFTLGEDQGLLGRELKIDLGADTQTVHVDYASSPSAAAVQWLEPTQTAGGEHPFLFTQSQAILARTWVPCQDTPGVRMTYDATVKVPSELLAVMSAENPTERSADGVYSFRMPQAIPSYLLALAVGDLEFRAMEGVTGVYAEPSVVEAAAYEFAETHQMMGAVEELYGPYRWGRYDILVLPPSFPFGGMENPRLTFATPTILAGDRSLVALIAHELAHSWSGNLVTNATWDDFWLNEGFTVYLERRIMEAVYDPAYVDMLSQLGLQDLRSTLGEVSPRDSHLHLDLTGRDPDDGMTDVAYEKGHFFLLTLEKAVGRERFDAFLTSWFEAKAFQSQTTADFMAYLEANLIQGDAALAEKVNVDAWVFGSGLPETLPPVRSARFEAVNAQLKGWAAGEILTADLATDAWTTHEWLHFLRGLPKGTEDARLAELDERFKLSATGNSEVLHAWLHHVIESRYEDGYPALRDFLTRQGRRKFLKPLYERMASHADLKPMAVDIYTGARPGYHSVSSNTIDAILDYTP